MRYQEIVKESEDAALLNVNGDRGLLSRNTIPGQQPWRVTWFDDDIEDDGGVVGHIDVSEDDANAIFSGVDVEIETEDRTYYVRRVDKN